MIESKRNILNEYEKLLESAKNNHLHKEIAKYLINNMNAIAGSVKRGWLNGASSDDMEYVQHYLALRDRYAAILYPESLLGDQSHELYRGEYHPVFDDSTIIESLQSYDFNNEAGKLILGMIQHNYAIRCNKFHTDNDKPERVAFAKKVVSVIKGMLPK